MALMMMIIIIIIIIVVDVIIIIITLWHRLTQANKLSACHTNSFTVFRNYILIYVYYVGYYKSSNNAFPQINTQHVFLPTFTDLFHTTRSCGRAVCTHSRFSAVPLEKSWNNTLQYPVFLHIIRS
jgi:hypothetical protein